MSAYTAVGAVSRTLQTLLYDRLDQPSSMPPGTSVPVTVGLPPDKADVQKRPLVNLFLFRISENGALKNQELPGHGDRGSYGHPPLALNLYYLLTTYGTTRSTEGPGLEDEVVAQYLLGSAMRILHDFAIITPAIETQGGVQVLDADLLNAQELLKLSLDPISLEDVSKVWTALTRPFRLSVAYEVTVIQIEPRLVEPHAQPVGQIGPMSGPKLRVVAGTTPIIDGLHAAARVGAQVRAGETLVLLGSGLLGEATEADIAGISGLGQVTSQREDRLTVVVPDDQRLQPGILGLRVSHGTYWDTPPQRRPTFVSNTVAFALVPRVDGCALAGGQITITGDRLIAPNVECFTLVGGETVYDSQYAGGATPEQIQVPLPTNLAPGVPVRVFVRVNGMQSIDIQTVTP